MPDALEGGCQCGNIRYRIDAEPMMAAICHCNSCRRAHAAPSVAWALFELGQVQFTGPRPKEYAASAEVQRGFCPDCGTPICFRGSYLPGLIDISIGSLDDPESVEPRFHFWYSSHLSWAEYADDLPRHAEFPPFGDD